MSTPRWCFAATIVFVLCVCVIADRLPPSIVGRRAATSDNDRKWANGYVFYTFGTRLIAARDRSFLFAIRDAMNKWEEQTCLRFFYRTVQTDYIEFTAADANKCACTRGYYPCCNSESVGNNGGKQVIELGQDCNSTGIVMQLIGLAVGFWHEHTRPDRDSYVSIIKPFVENNAFDKFVKRKRLEVDHQADSYDYGSIMHPPRDYFSIIPGVPTIEVNNLTAFSDQGTPNIGQRGNLSRGDITQANRMYHCPRNGASGILNIYIADSNNFSAYSLYPTVKVTAVDHRGNKYTYSTTVAEGETQIPTWNQMIYMGENNWQFFRIQVWNETEEDFANALSMSETVPVTQGNHSMLKHCIDVDCASYVYFSYSLLEDVDECSSNPCQNGGTCTDEIANFTCTCPLGYTGRHCEQKIWCIPNPCQNNGTCRENGSSYRCSCPTRYHGSHCQYRDSCLSNPCQNRGTCNRTGNSFSCTCPAAYYGSFCQYRDACLSNPCLNGGTCNRSGSSYRCSCSRGYHGSRCQYRDACLSNSCLNGGTCNSTGSSYRCNCPRGYHGSRCQYRDACLSNPCLNGGRCSRSGSSYRCYCPRGYHGSRCQYRDACLSNPCLNGGTCSRSGSSYTCNCRSGYYGSSSRDRCQYRDACLSNPCLNGGTCSRSGSLYRCSCSRGYHGSRCQYRDACLSNPCLNGGTCSRSGSSYTCNCRSGYYGSSSRDRCRYRDACLSNPCLNRGTCSRSGSLYRCSCPRGYYGSRCQYRDACLSNPCRNGGTCSRSGSSYTCRCTTRYSGTRCTSCASRYIGSQCQHRVGNLRIYARGGTGLPDEDGWLNNSDPFLEVIAYDYLGNSLRKRTDDDGGDQSPEWNEWLNFGTRAWKRFTVRVWDKDLIYHDALSRTYTFYLSSAVSVRYRRINCYSGYVRFDYFFN